ncbi:MAG TPA: hypothetical protein VE077_09770 [Candidatus Methylomirabilis sp.]|nr:hypothetical protein [Candidatus Methylomirabilis sp.]
MPFRLIAICVIVVVTSTSQTLRLANPLEKKLAVDSQTTTSVNHVSALLRRAGVWGGIESYDTDCGSPLEYRIPSLDGTVRDGLVQLKSQDNSLSWKVQGDGILISRHAQETSLLDAMVPDLTFYGRDPADKSTDKLLNLPAVKDQMTKLKLTLRSPELGFAQLPAHVSSVEQITLKNLTLREALNAIAKSDRPRVWLFGQSACGGQTTVLVQWLVK